MVKWRSACLMLKSMLSDAASTATAPCYRRGCACDEDGRSSCSCWAATALPVMRAHILQRASISWVEAPSPLRLTLNSPVALCSTSGVLAPVPVSAEGWTAEAEVLADSGMGAGAGARAAVASAPVKRILAIRSWILPQGGSQIVGGDQALRWTPTQQPLDMQGYPQKGIRPKAPSETSATTQLGLPSQSNLLLLLFLLLLLLYCNMKNWTLKPKDQEGVEPLGALFSLMRACSITRIPLFIGGPGSVHPPQLHLFLSWQATLHAFQGYYSNF
jgi:hypothetical protein